MADISELVVRIKADAAQLEREMKRAQGIVQQSTKTMGGGFGVLNQQIRSLIPAISLIGFVAFQRHAINAGDALSDMSKRTGVAVETLSKFRLVAQQNGTTVEAVGRGFKDMQISIADAADASSAAARAFKQLGISVSDLDGLTDEQRFLLIVDRINQFSSASDRASLKADIFKRSGYELGAVMDGGSEKIKKAMDQAERLGLVISKEQADKMDDFNDKWAVFVGLCERFAQSGFVQAYDAFARVYNKTVGSDTRVSLGDLDNLTQVQDRIAALQSLRQRTVNALNSEDDPSKFPDLRAKILDYQQQINEAGKAGMGMYGPNPQSTSGEAAPGKKLVNVNPEIEKATKSLADYNDELQHQHEFAGMSPRDAAAQKAYYDTLALAQKAGAKNAEGLAQSYADVARSTYDMAQQQAEATRFTAEIKDQFAETAGSIITNSKNAADAVGNLAKALAEIVAKKYILGPLADSLFGSGGGSGLLGDALGGLFNSPTDNAISSSIAANSGFGGFFAEGGSPPVGRPSIVGENGPEIFVPKSAGTVLPNNKIGGTSIVVNQTFQISPGVPELINASIRQAAPAIAAMAHAGVFQAMQNGGSESRIAGLRS